MAGEVAELRAESVSSVQINTSTRGHDITVKVYAGSPVREAGDAALDEYLRIRAELERRLMGPMSGANVVSDPARKLAGGN